MQHTIPIDTCCNKHKNLRCCKGSISYCYGQTWFQFFSSKRIKGLLFDDFPGKSNSISKVLSIFFSGQVVGVNNGMVIWIQRLKLHVATTCSPQCTDKNLENKAKTGLSFVLILKQDQRAYTEPCRAICCFDEEHLLNGIIVHVTWRIFAW